MENQIRSLKRITEDSRYEGETQRFNMARTAADLGLSRWSEREFSAILSESSSSSLVADSSFEIGRRRLWERKFPEARKHFNRCLRERPDHKQCREYLGWFPDEEQGNGLPDDRGGCI